MKAVVMTRAGGPEVVEIRDLEDPKPGRGEALVRVRAVALNHLDIWVLKGRPGPDLAHGHVLGSDAAGVVEALGEDAFGVGWGDEVVVNPGLCCGSCAACRAGEHSLCPSYSLVGLSRSGTFAELVALPVSCLAPRPKRLSWTEAAALTLAHLTAWRMLFTRARLAPGETVLIHGIGGGVALAALQLARLVGAEAIVTSSSAAKLERARALGAQATIDYTREDVGARAKALTGGRGVDVVLDTVGAATLPASLAAVRKGGRIVTCGATGGSRAEVDLRSLYWNQVELLGSTMGSIEEHRRLLAAVSANGLKPVMSAELPLEQAREALELMNRGAQFGKIALRVG